MSIFKKIADMINGTAPAPAPAEKPVEKPAEQPAEQPVEQPAEQPVEQPAEKPVEQPAEQPVGDAPTAAEKELMYADDPASQSFGWHKYLVRVLSEVQVEDSDIKKLRFFTIFIRQTAGCSYGWINDGFRSNLRKPLERFDVASHIGSGTLNVEVVSEKDFNKLLTKRPGDTLFLKPVDGIFLMGSEVQTNEQKFATAIDKRFFVVQSLVKELQSAAGTNSTKTQHLTIVVVKHDNNALNYAWADEKFVKDLKLALANAFLHNIGSKSLQVDFLTREKAEGLPCLIDNQVYYHWEAPAKDGSDSNHTGRVSVSPEPEKTEYKRVTARLELLEGTGSMVKNVYMLDSDQKKTYHIGRGARSRKGSIVRVNDIIIKDNEPDSELAKYNAYVSSAHADIVLDKGRAFIRAAAGGCRPAGGSPTKFVRNEKDHELRDTLMLYPLEDGDLIELGKSVCLMFNIVDADFKFKQQETNHE